MTLNLETFTTLAADISAFLPLAPQIVAAFNAYKTVWTAINPSLTEADFENHLTALASANITAADAILLRDGYVKDATGKWSKP